MAEVSSASVPTLPCPSCDKPTPRLLDTSSKDAAVNYYRCDHCGHVWTIDKDTGLLIKHVTPLTSTKRVP
jgi:hypothetical protein